MSGLEDGGRGGSGLFNLAGEGLESGSMEFGSEGGAFSLEDLGFLGGLPLIPALGHDEEGWSAAWVSRKIPFLGCIKCFIGKKRRIGGSGKGFDREKEE